MFNRQLNDDQNDENICFVITLLQVRNPASNICLDILNKDEKTVFEVGLFYCQNGASANQVITIIQYS